MFSFNTNFDPLINKLKKHSSSDKKNPEEEISNLENVFKNELKSDFDSDKKISPGKLRKIGDLNNDGKVDFEDVLKLKEILEGKLKPNEEELECADLNHDGVVDYEDLNLMINLVVGSRRAEDRVLELQSVYDELKMNLEQGLTNPDVDRMKISAVKAELEQAIADFILQSNNIN